MVLAASGVHAQTASPEDIASARALGTEGTRLADTGDCNGAIPKLEAAEKLFHAPTTLERLGECEVSVGRIVAGTESLNRVVREPLAANAPPVFVAAKKRAQQALSAAQPRIGNLRIHVEGAPVDKTVVTVDGVVVSSALLDADRPTDPGAHEVNASAPGYQAVTANVTVSEGAESPVSLKLEVGPTAVAGTPGAPAAVTMAPATTAALPAGGSGGPSRGPAIAAFAVGGVGLVVGTVVGILALGTKSTLDSECVSKTCPATARSDIDSLGSKATVATIGFGVGIVGVAVGAVLLAVSHPSDAPRAAAGFEPARPHWSPWIGVAAAGVGGTFQ